MIGKIDGNLKSNRIFKKKPEYQLLFELLNKVLLPRAEQRSLAAIQDLFLMEALATFQPVNLLTIIIKNVLKIKSIKDRIHSLGRKAKIALLQEEQASKGLEKEPGVIQNLQVKNVQLETENVALRKQVEDLAHQMLQESGIARNFMKGFQTLNSN
ncbi:hypothetical protein HAX54_005441 [Datura stramonium]|uniref:Uncharacterized protein n=1 Tax=Datura stramonium TaxID=4076 RepID=A0ABS8TA73_DATST|nr:hypothetical protein [Datura stramonium]